MILFNPELAYIISDIVKFFYDIALLDCMYGNPLPPSPFSSPIKSRLLSLTYIYIYIYLYMVGTARKYQFNFSSKRHILRNTESNPSRLGCPSYYYLDQPLNINGVHAVCFFFQVAKINFDLKLHFLKK